MNHQNTPETISSTSWDHPFRRSDIDYVKADARNYTRESTEQVGTHVAKELGYSPASELPALVEQLGGTIQYVDIPLYEQTNRSGSILVHGTCDFTIILPKFSSRLRDRFSIAHELGHYFLHSDQGTIPIWAERFGSTRPEWEANWFAAGFLMPRAEFLAELSSDKNIEQVARTFDVSVQAAEVRRAYLHSIQD